MHYKLAVGFLLGLAAACCAWSDDVVDADTVEQKFEKLDRDRSKSLSLTEFLAGAGAPDIAKRDFRLFDQDADKALTFQEFRTVSTVVPADQRGPLPDPLLFLVEQAVAAMDESFDDWDAKPDLEIEAQRFVGAFASTLGPNSTRPNIVEADEDGSQTVSRNEARRFMEIQLGVRCSDGELLRDPSGRVVNLLRFQTIDENRNDQIEKEEILNRANLRDKAQEIFDRADTDRNQSVSFEEWASLPSHGFFDLVNDFWRLDTNLDAYVDPAELAAGGPARQQNLASHVFPGFDMDQDGRLALIEYRLTMQANPLLPWHQVICDPNGDGKISFAEFKFGSSLGFPLLRWIYFQRLDLDSSGLLDSTEFFFRAKLPNEFFVMGVDGTGWRPLYKFDGYPACGSPAVSPDGMLIAFDAWKINPRTATELFVMDIDGGEPRRVCTGAMPAWSPDGEQLAFSHSGVRIVSSDGDDERVFARRGWGAQWSPDGQRITYTEGAQIKAYDVETKKAESVLDGGRYGYTRIHWNMAWSPDSRRICFKGVKGDGAEEVITENVDGEPELKVHYSVHRYVVADFAWHPDGDRIVFGARCPERECHQLYEFNPDLDDQPKLLVGQNATRNNMGYCWTPDGTQLIVASGDF